MWKVILPRGDIAPTTLFLFRCYRFLDYSSVQRLCQPLEKNVPQTCMVWIHETDDKQWETVAFMLQLLAQSGWVNALAKGDDGNQQQDQELTYWAGLFSLKQSVTERTSFSLVNFSEHDLLFKRWWNIIKEHVHYWCLSRKFLLTSASFHLYNAISNESICITLGKSYSCIICNMNHLFYSKQR